MKPVTETTEKTHKSEEECEIKAGYLLGHETAMVVPDNLPYNLVVLHLWTKILRIFLRVLRFWGATTSTVESTAARTNTKMEFVWGVGVRSETSAAANDGREGFPLRERETTVPCFETLSFCLYVGFSVYSLWKMIFLIFFFRNFQRKN